MNTYDQLNAIKKMELSRQLQVRIFNLSHEYKTLLGKAAGQFLYLSSELLGGWTNEISSDMTTIFSIPFSNKEGVVSTVSGPKLKASVTGIIHEAELTTQSQMTDYILMAVNNACKTMGIHLGEDEKEDKSYFFAVYGPNAYNNDKLSVLKIFNDGSVIDEQYHTPQDAQILNDFKILHGSDSYDMRDEETIKYLMS